MSLYSLIHTWFRPAVRTMATPAATAVRPGVRGHGLLLALWDAFRLSL